LLEVPSSDSVRLTLINDSPILKAVGACIFENHNEVRQSAQMHSSALQKEQDNK
jgi:hypothetical protein